MPGARQLGGRDRRALGADHPLGPRRHRRVRGAARGRGPGGVRRAVAQGRRSPRLGRLPRPLRHLAVLVREQASEAVGFGWINLRRSGGRGASSWWPYDVEQPIAPAIRDWARGWTPRSAPTRDSWPAPTCARDARRARRRGPGDGRAPPADRFPSRPPRRHRRGGARRCLRRRPDGRADPRRGRAAARARPGRHARDLPAARAGARGGGILSAAT